MADALRSMLCTLGSTIVLAAARSGKSLRCPMPHAAKLNMELNLLANVPVKLEYTLLARILWIARSSSAARGCRAGLKRHRGWCVPDHSDDVAAL
jgi:hypothetical protein